VVGCLSSASWIRCDRSLERIKSKTPDTDSDLLSVLDLQDVLVLNLGRTVQICVDIAVHILSERLPHQRFSAAC